MNGIIRFFAKRTLLIAALLSAVVFLALTSSTPASADEEEDRLRNEVNELQEKIDQSEEELQEIQAEADTLANKISLLDGQIDNVQDEIVLTELKIEQITLDIAKTEKEIENRKVLLKESLRLLYVEGNLSTFELLVVSDGFTDFVNKQEYIQRIKDAVQDSTEQVITLKEKQESDKKRQDNLLSEQSAQKQILADQRGEKNILLEKTRGEEAEYQVLVEDLRAQRDAADAAVNAYVASLIQARLNNAASAVSLGPVNAGDIIGTLGNTGYSTGAHLHYNVSQNGSPVNPYNYLNNGWLFPSNGVVTQGFGCTPYGIGGGCPAGLGYHDAIDVAGPEGIAVIAPAAGEIIHRGCLSEGTIFSNYAVIIDHGDGVTSLFAHLQAPNAGFSCAVNTFSGALSVQG